MKKTIMHCGITANCVSIKCLNFTSKYIQMLSAATSKYMLEVPSTKSSTLDGHTNKINNNIQSAVNE